TGDPQFINPAGPDGVLGFSTTTVGPATIIDDGDAGYTQNAGWTTVATGGYQNDYRQAYSNSYDVSATYTFTGLTPGAYYQVAATWPAAGSGYSGTLYTVHSGNQSDRL